jgi:hypothetical protein
MFKVCRRLALLLFSMPSIAFGFNFQEQTKVAEPSVTKSDLRFDRDIRPILSRNCFACHGFDEEARQSDLRLDITNETFLKVIASGKPDKSVLFQRIISTDAAERMPPSDSHLELKAEEIERIKRWIEEGGQPGSHWSLVAPQRPETPKLEQKLVPQTGNAIDLFIRAPLSEIGLHPSPEADRYTLIRRAYLDLLGLPPSAKEVQAFVNDADPQAYEKLVKRLLENQHYGERMALPWLDSARYADTNGYSIDGGRNMWLWRDWVIQAYNDNLPYDQFLREQLAGDLLPAPTESQKIATGFQRNNMVTHEGGTIPEENIANYNADRMKTFGEAVLGLTLACAQCHDHKYDPITQEEYFQLTAFFNTLDDRGLDGDGGRNPVPSIDVQTPIKTNDLAEVTARITELEHLMATIDPALQSRWESELQKRRESRGKDFKLHAAEVLNVTTPNMGSGFEVDGFNGVRITGFGGLSAFDMALKLPDLQEPIRGLRVTFHPLPESKEGSWGAGKRKLKVGEKEFEKGTFVLTGFSVTADKVRSDQVSLYSLEAIESVTASSWEANFPPTDSLDPRNTSGWSPQLTDEGPVHFTVTLAEPIDVSATPFMTLQLNFGFGDSSIPGKFEIEVFTGIHDDSELPTAIEKIALQPSAERSVADQQAVWQYCAAHSSELQHERIELENLRERQQVLTEKFSTMVMHEAEKPRETFVLNRGDYAQPLHKVSAKVPSSLPPFDASMLPNRAGLAGWVTMKSHPLTARVAVNRFWEQLFGRGLVVTSADFGSQGEFPSHPELLDWLAIEFQESGWDVKKLIYLMMTSATYRQSSFSSPEALAQDPENKWLARGPRFRLPAELIRDTTLKVSGLLVPRLGGPSVNPYTPGDPWREVSHYGSTPATAQVFVQDHGEKLYRRSLYTFWKRTAPPTNLTIFDAPNREVCTVWRPTTTTPLQSLVLLNDVQFVEASRAFAERVLQRSETDAQRLAWAFLECVGRPISENESAILLEALARERKRYGQDLNRAQRLLSNGESRRDESLDPSEHAAWSTVCQRLLNLSEMIVRH